MEQNSLTKVLTDDGLYLHGYYAGGRQKNVGVVYVHGMDGEFYKDSYITLLSEEIKRLGMGFVTGNTRGAGKETDFEMKSGGMRRIGSRYELLEESHFDITAWIRYMLDKEYKRIVLVGHSAGTIKVVRYLTEGELKNRVCGLVLLAPIDPVGGRVAHGRDNLEKYLSLARAKVREGRGEELISMEFDHDMLSYQTFISWYRRDPLGMMFEFCGQKNEFPVLRRIKIPTQVIVGTLDQYFHPTNPTNLQEAMGILQKNISSVRTKFIEGSGHNFVGYEKVLVREVGEFLGQWGL